MLEANSSVLASKSGVMDELDRKNCQTQRLREIQQQLAEIFESNKQVADFFKEACFLQERREKIPNLCS